MAILKCIILTTDRKQGAGLSSGSSAAVHKAHYITKLLHFYIIGKYW